MGILHCWHCWHCCHRGFALFIWAFGIVDIVYIVDMAVLRCCNLLRKRWANLDAINFQGGVRQAQEFCLLSNWNEMIECCKKNSFLFRKTTMVLHHAIFHVFLDCTARLEFFLFFSAKTSWWTNGPLDHAITFFFGLYCKTGVLFESLVAEGIRIYLNCWTGAWRNGIEGGFWCSD